MNARLTCAKLAKEMSCVRPRRVKELKARIRKGDYSVNNRMVALSIMLGRTS